MFRDTTGGILFGKEASDAAVAYAYKDRVYFIISCVGYGCDAFQFLASFALGPNVTALVPLPVSAACKTLVWVNIGIVNENARNYMSTHVTKFI